ncbi:MAG: hypothetical protein ACPGDB_04735, partial [Fusobacterium sp.]
NMELFIKNYRPYYERGFKRIILPFKHWMLTGRIHEEFPDIYVKNTIINKDYSAQDIYESAKAGYDYVYVDREVMRDKRTYEQYPLVKKKIKEDFGKDIKISLLVNEGCIGKCPLRTEHYSYNFNKKPNDKMYFTDKISTVSCSVWKKDKSYLLKTLDLVPVRKEFEHYSKYFDVFKLHGRDNFYKMLDGINIMYNLTLGNEILESKRYSMYMDRIGNKNTLYEYMNKVKECGMQCWNCDYCDKINKLKENKK